MQPTRGGGREANLICGIQISKMVLWHAKQRVGSRGKFGAVYLNDIFHSVGPRYSGDECSTAPHRGSQRSSLSISSVRKFQKIYFIF